MDTNKTASKKQSKTCGKCGTNGLYWHQSYRTGRYYLTTSATDRTAFHACPEPVADAAADQKVEDTFIASVKETNAMFGHMVSKHAQNVDGQLQPMTIEQVKAMDIYGEISRLAELTAIAICEDKPKVASDHCFSIDQAIKAYAAATAKSSEELNAINTNLNNLFSATFKECYEANKPAYDAIKADQVAAAQAKSDEDWKAQAKKNIAAGRCPDGCCGGEADRPVAGWVAKAKQMGTDEGSLVHEASDGVSVNCVCGNHVTRANQDNTQVYRDRENDITHWTFSCAFCHATHTVYND